MLELRTPTADGNEEIPAADRIADRQARDEGTLVAAISAARNLAELLNDKDVPADKRTYVRNMTSELLNAIFTLRKVVGENDDLDRWTRAEGGLSTVLGHVRYLSGQVRHEGVTPNASQRRWLMGRTSDLLQAIHSFRAAIKQADQRENAKVMASANPRG